MLILKVPYSNTLFDGFKLFFFINMVVLILTDGRKLSFRTDNLNEKRKSALILARVIHILCNYGLVFFL